MPRRGNQLDAWQIRTLADLKKIGFEDLDIDLIEQEEAEMKAMEELEEKELTKL